MYSTETDGEILDNSEGCSWISLIQLDKLDTKQELRKLREEGWPKDMGREFQSSRGDSSISKSVGR
jgi:hypothetical protein